MHIREITALTPELDRAVSGLLQQLTDGRSSVRSSLLEEIIRSENSHLFCAADGEGRCIGMATVGVYHAPTGKKAWIEDVVVTEESRGLGIGEALVKHAVRFAEAQGADVLMLTSRPSRAAANRLYRRLGFERRETNVYSMALPSNGKTAI